MNHNKKILLDINYNNYNIHIFSAIGYSIDPEEATVYLITSGVKNYYRIYRLVSLDKYIAHELTYYGEKYKKRAEVLSEIKEYLVSLTKYSADENLMAIKNCIRS